MGVVPVWNAEGRIGDHDAMGFCTVIFPLECEGWNEGLDFFLLNVLMSLRSLAYILWCSHWK